MQVMALQVVIKVIVMIIGSLSNNDGDDHENIT